MESDPGPIGVFIPLIILQIPLVVIGFLVANRKGEVSIWWKVILFFPFFGVVALFYLVSITDKAVYDKLDNISDLLERRTA